MPDRQPSLDQQTIDILLSVIETPHAVVTSAVLDGFYAAKAPALKASGLLELKDHRRAAVSLADHDDEPVNLSWSPEHRGYGYFSPSAGWVPVSDGQMASFGISFEKLFKRMVATGGQSARLECDIEGFGWLLPVQCGSLPPED